MRKLVLSGACALMSYVAFASITVSDVQVFSGYPWKEVVVGYTITGTDIEDCKIRLIARDKMSNKSYTAKELTGAGFTEGRHVLRWNAAAQGVKFSSANVVFEVSALKMGVQLWKEGPYWAICNVGASKPEEYGYYFWWGDTVGYERYGGYRWVDRDRCDFTFSGENCPTDNKDIGALKSAGYIDSTGNLAAKCDAATARLGAPWRMPTAEEWAALPSNCDRTWTTRNGVPGLLVTGRGTYASKSIFLPASGYGSGSDLISAGSYCNYWSSKPSSPSSGVHAPNYYAWCFHSESAGYCYMLSGTYYRFYGLPVRPVRGFAQ